MMNALGSKYNTRPFVLCGSKLNNNKLQVRDENGNAFSNECLDN